MSRRLVDLLLVSLEQLDLVSLILDNRQWVSHLVLPAPGYLSFTIRAFLAHSAFLGAAYLYYL